MSEKDLTKSVALLTETMTAVLFALRRGPLWGSTGDTDKALDKAETLLDEVRDCLPKPVTTSSLKENHAILP